MILSRRVWLGTGVASAAVLSATLPNIMSALLRHMFTAPNQMPWEGGRLRLIDVGGMPAQALNSAERSRDLVDGSFLHREGDVWVVSYVKSGTTWTIGILAALWKHPSADYAGHLQKVTRNFCPQPELPDLGWKDDGFGHSIRELNDWPGTPHRCFKSHWPSKDHVAANRKSKFIYVIRNAQDQITSHWNQVYGMGFHYGTENMTFEGGWDGFVEDWLNGDVENGQYFEHVASWYSRRDDPDVLFVRFEDLKRDPRDVIRRIASFVGVDASPVHIETVIEMTSFEKMRHADEQDAGLRFMRWLGVIRRKHVRQGEIGSGKFRFSRKQLAALELEYEKKAKPLGVPREWVLLGEAAPQF
mmetsp:Transcript_53659/g.113962  ORF Transcript_53659/g.113962 Transcript_53659/m.113962 type:complete len:358 (-) Transcript_53659:525-1598(-)